VRLGVRVDDYSGPLSLLRRYDLWHIHWPDFAMRAEGVRAAYRALKFLGVISLARLLGTRIIWTAHNLTPHERSGRRVVDFYWKRFVRRIDGVISLTSAGVPELLGRFPGLEGKPLAITPHGHYRDFYPTPPSREEARAALGIPPGATVFLYFGLIRPYKNVPELVRAFSKLEDANARLIICGEPRRVNEQTIMSEWKADPRVMPKLGRIPEEEVAVAFAGSDLVVLPIRRPFNSGTLMLALSFARPVLIGWSPTVSEIRDLVGGAWIHTYEHDLTPEGLRRAAATLDRTGGSPDLSDFEWEPIASATLRLYQRVLGPTDNHSAPEAPGRERSERKQ
jgi:beta-1,4-mannosyltransferase